MQELHTGSRWCAVHWCAFHISVKWVSQFDQWIWTRDSWPLWKLRALLGAALTCSITDTLACRHWRLAIIFSDYADVEIWSSFCVPSWESLSTVRECRHLPWHSHDKVFTSMDSNTAVKKKKPVQIFPTGQSLRWRKTTQSEDAITYTSQIWPSHDIST